MKKTAEQIANTVLIKISGYWQNIVGFQDLPQFETLRSQLLNSEKPFDFEQRKLLRKQLSPANIKGEDFGYFGKYVSVPELIAAYATDPLSNRPTGTGYLPREAMLKRLKSVANYEDPDIIKDITQKIEASTYPYFTSTMVV